jgi:N-succinyldiaminopimelate aminotransferase
VGLQLGDDYFTGFAADMRDKSDRLRTGLEDAGFDVFRPHGTYFITTDIRPFGEHDGLAFCRSLPERCGVVAVPNVVFYDDKEEGAPLVRFAFCKRHEVIDEAVARLKGLAR